MYEDEEDDSYEEYSYNPYGGIRTVHTRIFSYRPRSTIYKLKNTPFSYEIKKKVWYKKNNGAMHPVEIEVVLEEIPEYILDDLLFSLDEL